MLLEERVKTFDTKSNQTEKVIELAMKLASRYL